MCSQLPSSTEADPPPNTNIQMLTNNNIGNVCKHSKFHSSVQNRTWRSVLNVQTFLTAAKTKLKLELTRKISPMQNKTTNMRPAKSSQAPSLKNIHVVVQQTSAQFETHCTTPPSDIVLFWRGRPDTFAATPHIPLFVILPPLICLCHFP